MRFVSNFIAGLILVAWFSATNHSLLVEIVPNTESDADGVPEVSRDVRAKAALVKLKTEKQVALLYVRGMT